MNLAEVIIRNGTEQSIQSKPFILYRDEAEKIGVITHGEFYRSSLEYGNMLKRKKQELGIKDSQRFHVGVFMQNIPEFFFILGGCAFTNSTLVGINNAQVGEKLAFDINNIDTNILFVDDAEQPGTGGTFLDTVLRAKNSFGFTTLRNEDIILTSRKHTKNAGDFNDIIETLQLYISGLDNFRPEELNELSTGVIIFTSGTTGAPKGIEVTWKKLCDVGITTTKILSYTNNDVGYICMPVNHSNSLYLNIMPALLNGAKLLLRRRFTVKNFVKDIEEAGATVWNCVGDPVQYLINYINNSVGKNADYSQLPLRTVISTGTNATNRAIFTKMFGLDIFTEVYGSTESGAMAAVDANTPDYSVGRVLMDVRILKEGTTRECALAQIDENGKILNLDACAGEICVSQKSLGASAFTGYYKLPEVSAGRICKLNGEDFYRMGDLGAVTEKQGAKYLIFLGRTGDWIRFKGENWAPVDGEKIVSKYEGVINAGFIGVPQPIGREDDPMLILEVKDQKSFPVDSFYNYCREKLPHYMVPRFLRFIEKMPMTETMKLKKSILKQEFYYRNPDLDALDADIIYEIKDSKAHPFTTADYKKEMARFTDPTNRDTLKAFTKRSDLFE